MSYGVRGAGYGLRGTRYEVRVTGYGLRVTGYGVWVTRYRLRVTGYGGRGTGYEMVASQQQQFPAYDLGSVMLHSGFVFPGPAGEFALNAQS